MASGTSSDPVLVPVQLEAFVLNPAVCGTGEPDDKGARIAPITQPNYTFLRLDNFLLQSDVQNHADLHSSAPAGMNSRLTDLGARPPKPLRHRHGVYLHWSLPRCYRSGLAASDAAPAERRRQDRLKRGMDAPELSGGRAPSPAAEAAAAATETTTTPEFIEPPTRWLVVRKLETDSIQPASARPYFQNKEWQGWVIESDYLWSLDKIPLDMDLQTDMAPFVVGQPGAKVNIEQQAEVFIGRKYPLEEWSEKPREPNQPPPPNISLLRSSNQLFADFQMHNANVFSMLDNFSYGGDPKKGVEPSYLSSARANYYLIGWHWKPEADPLWRSGRTGAFTHAESLEALMMAMVGGQGAASPPEDWLADRTQLRLMCHGAMYGVVWDHEHKPEDVPADRFAARLRDQDVAAISVGTTPMDALVSYCSARKGKGSDPPSIHKMEEDILAIYSLLHARDDGVEAQREAKDTVYNWAFSRSAGGTHFFLSGEDAEGKPVKPNPEAVKKLRELNQAQTMLDACNRTLLQYRWDMFSCWWKYVSDVGNKKDELQNQQFKRDADAITAKIDRLAARVSQLDGIVKALQTEAEAVPGDGNVLANAKPGTEPFFFRGRDPTVLVGGIESGWAVDYMDKLNIRLPSLVINWLETADTGMFWLPPGLEAFLPVLLPKLPTELRAAGKDLLTEFHLLRPEGTFAPSEATTADGLPPAPPVPPAGKAFPQFHDPKGSGGRWRDQWGNRQPFFPLYAEWEAEYTHVPWDYWKLDEQTARLSANKMVRYGVTIPSGKPLWEELGQRGKPDTRRLSGRVLMLPQPSFSLQAKVQQLFTNTPPAVLDKYLPKEDRDQLLANIGQLAYLSSPLSGFTDGLLTLSQGSHLKPENKTVGADGAVNSEAISAAVFEAAGFSAKTVARINNNSALTPLAARTRFEDNGYCPFKPVTHGQFQFLKLNIIDKFGQTLVCIDPEPKPTGPDPIYPCISDFYEPQLIKYQEEDHANTVLQNREKLCEYLQLPPSINQNARLNACFVRRTADDPPELRVTGIPNPATWRPATEWENPIWGWVITNYADNGIQLFYGDGTFYRELRFGGAGGTIASPRWEPFAPDKGTNASPDRQADTRQLDLLVERLSDKDYLTGFWHMIVTAQDNLPPAPTSYAQFLNAIVGKPLALVNIGFSLELDAPPLVIQSTNSAVNKPERMLLPPARSDDKSKHYRFQVRLGNREAERDGLVGYFDTTSLTTPYAAASDVLDLGHINTFFAPLPSADPSQIPPLRRLTTETYPTFTAFHQAHLSEDRDVSPLAFSDRRNSRLQVYGAVIEPFTPLHAYSSILPPSSLQLPSWTWQGALNNMTAFFHAGPMTLTEDVQPYNAAQLLTTQNWRDVPTVAVGLHALKGTEWNWLQPYDPESEGAAAVAQSTGLGVETLFNAYGVEMKGSLDKPGFQQGPYTAVEGFLQLRNPVMAEKVGGEGA